MYASRDLAPMGQQDNLPHRCQAGVTVQPAKGQGKPKVASTHDLRRNGAERLALAWSSRAGDSGVPKACRRRDNAEKLLRWVRVQEAAGIIPQAVGCTEVHCQVKSVVSPRALGRIDPNPWFRRPVLYPIELRTRILIHANRWLWCLQGRFLATLILHRVVRP